MSSSQSQSQRSSIISDTADDEIENVAMEMEIDTALALQQRQVSGSGSGIEQWSNTNSSTLDMTTDFDIDINVADQHWLWHQDLQYLQWQYANASSGSNQRFLGSQSQQFAFRRGGTDNLQQRSTSQVSNYSQQSQTQTQQQLKFQQSQQFSQQDLTASDRSISWLSNNSLLLVPTAKANSNRNRFLSSSWQSQSRTWSNSNQSLGFSRSSSVMESARSLSVPQQYGYTQNPYASASVSGASTSTSSSPQWQNQYEKQTSAAANSYRLKDRRLRQSGSAFQNHSRSGKFDDSGADEDFSNSIIINSEQQQQSQPMTQSEYEQWIWQRQSLSQWQYQQQLQQYQWQQQQQRSRSRSRSRFSLSQSASQSSQSLQQSGDQLDNQAEDWQQGLELEGTEDLDSQYQQYTQQYWDYYAQYGQWHSVSPTVSASRSRSTLRWSWRSSSTYDQFPWYLRETRYQRERESSAWADLDLEQEVNAGEVVNQDQPVNVQRQSMHMHQLWQQQQQYQQHAMGISLPLGLQASPSVLQDQSQDWGWDWEAQWWHWAQSQVWQVQNPHDENTNINTNSANSNDYYDNNYAFGYGNWYGEFNNWAAGEYSPSSSWGETKHSKNSSQYGNHNQQHNYNYKEKNKKHKQMEKDAYHLGKEIDDDVEFRGGIPAKSKSKSSKKQHQLRDARGDLINALTQQQQQQQEQQRKKTTMCYLWVCITIAIVIFSSIIFAVLICVGWVPCDYCSSIANPSSKNKKSKTKQHKNQKNKPVDYDTSSGGTSSRADDQGQFRDDADWGGNYYDDNQGGGTGSGNNSNGKKSGGGKGNQDDQGRININPNDNQQSEDGDRIRPEKYKNFGLPEGFQLTSAILNRIENEVGMPKGGKDESGEPLYSQEQIETLKRIVKEAGYKGYKSHEEYDANMRMLGRTCMKHNKKDFRLCDVWAVPPQPPSPEDDKEGRGEGISGKKKGKRYKGEGDGQFDADDVVWYVNIVNNCLGEDKDTSQCVIDVLLVAWPMLIWQAGAIFKGLSDAVYWCLKALWRFFRKLMLGENAVKRKELWEMAIDNQAEMITQKKNLNDDRKKILQELEDFKNWQKEMEKQWNEQLQKLQDELDLLKSQDLQAETDQEFKKKSLIISERQKRYNQWKQQVKLLKKQDELEFTKYEEKCKKELDPILEKIKFCTKEEERFKKLNQELGDLDVMKLQKQDLKELLEAKEKDAQLKFDGDLKDVDIEDIENALAYLDEKDHHHHGENCENKKAYEKLRSRIKKQQNLKLMENNQNESSSLIIQDSDQMIDEESLMSEVEVEQEKVLYLGKSFEQSEMMTESDIIDLTIDN